MDPGRSLSSDAHSRDPVAGMTTVYGGRVRSPLPAIRYFEKPEVPTQFLLQSHIISTNAVLIRAAINRLAA